MPPSSARPRRGAPRAPGEKNIARHRRNPTAESFDEDLAEDASLDPPLSSETPSQDTSQDTSQDERRRLFGSSARVTRAEARRDRWKNAASPGGLLQRVQLYAPRFPVVSSAFLLAALAVFAPVVDRAYHKLHTEGRVVSDVASVAYDVGRFTVAWDATALRLAVTHDDEVDARLLDDDDAAKISRRGVAEAFAGAGPSSSASPPRESWATVPGSPFLIAAHGPVRIHQMMAGHFRVRLNRRLQTSVQTVDEIEAVEEDGAEDGARGGDDDDASRFADGHEYLVRKNVRAKRVIVRGTLIKEDAFLDRIGQWLGDARAHVFDGTAQRREFKARAKLRAKYEMAFSAPEPPGDTQSAEGLTKQNAGPDATAEKPIGWGSNRLAFAVRVDDSVPGVQRSPGGYRKPISLNQITLRYASDADERFYGLGEQFSSAEHGGKRVPILAAEQGIGRGKQPLTWTFNRLLRGSGGSWHTTYTSIPHYVTSKARSVHLTDFSYGEFDFTDDDAVSVAYVPVPSVSVSSPASRITRDSLGDEPQKPQRKGGDRTRFFDTENATVTRGGATMTTMTGEIIGARTVARAVAAYTEHAGRQKPLPKWAREGGVILGMTGGAERVKRVLEKMRSWDVPVAGLWLQDWGGTRNTSIGIERVWWNWVLDEEAYPDWASMRDDARAIDDARVLTYVNPFLMRSRGNKGALYREAKAKGYMVTRQKSGKVYLLGTEPGVGYGLLDLTNPAAAAWIEDIIVAMARSTGASGWMADFGEYLPFDCALHSGESPLAVHNRYPEMWAAINRGAMRRAGLLSERAEDDGDVSEESEETEGVFWSRSASAKSPRFSSLFWLGDQLVSWDAHDGMKSALCGMLSGGLSGLALSHSDVGGYTATPGNSRGVELLKRWMELSALSDAVFRTHQGNRPFHNAQPWDSDDLMEHLKWFAKLHQILGAYRAFLMRETKKTGVPVTRPMVLHYASDATASRLATQFLIGRDLLAVPVMDRGAGKAHAYLPPGDVWLDVWTTQQAPAQGHGFGGDLADLPPGTEPGHGAWVTADAPLGWPAVFVRRGAGAEATRAAGAMREWAAERGGVPPGRRITPMDPVEKLVLGLY